MTNKPIPGFLVSGLPGEPLGAAAPSRPRLSRHALPLLGAALLLLPTAAASWTATLDDTLEDVDGVQVCPATSLGWAFDLDGVLGIAGPAERPVAKHLDCRGHHSGLPHPSTTWSYFDGVIAACGGTSYGAAQSCSVAFPSSEVQWSYPPLGWTGLVRYTVRGGQTGAVVDDVLRDGPELPDVDGVDMAMAQEFVQSDPCTNYVYTGYPVSVFATSLQANLDGGMGSCGTATQPYGSWKVAVCFHPSVDVCNSHLFSIGYFN
jgi:hypothetical protein